MLKIHMLKIHTNQNVQYRQDYLIEKKKTNQRDKARQQKLRRKAAVMGELKRKY